MNSNNWQKKKILSARQHQDVIFKALNNQNYIKRQQKTITLDDHKEYIEFISCSYLGLDQDSRLVNSLSNHVDEAGIIFSSARTRMKYKPLDDFEDILNQIFTAHTVIFSTTHLVHLGLIPLIASGEMPSVNIDVNGCHFLLDQQVHASIQINRGLMQQFGEVDVLDFHDLEKLETTLQCIKARSQTPLLFCDSICSMGGIMPLTELLNLVNKYSGYLYLDDAHGMSIYGKNGAGYVLHHFGHLPDRVILATSLAKGFGVCGSAIVLPTLEDAEFVKIYCSTYVFSGTLINPLINACIASGSIHLSPEINTLQKKLVENVHLFDSLIKNNQIIINFSYDAPIRGVLVGDELAAIEMGMQLKNAGFLASVATYPIRKKGSAIVRLVLCASHTKKEIEQVCQTINLLI